VVKAKQLQLGLEYTKDSNGLSMNVGKNNIRNVKLNRNKWKTSAVEFDTMEKE